MALPGHSPPPLYQCPGSPTRNMMNGHFDTQLPPMYGTHTHSMLPPSPQNYRFPNPPPIPGASSSLPFSHESRNVPPYQRPSSGMSISSMLGGEFEKPVQEVYQNSMPRDLSRHGSLSGPAPYLISAISPPHQALKPGLGEYTYNPRSQTPDRLSSACSSIGARQRSSSSGNAIQRSGPLIDSHGCSASVNAVPRYHDQPMTFVYNGIDMGKNEQDDRTRWTSLNGTLQKFSSQPQAMHVAAYQQDFFRPNMVPMPNPEQRPRADIPPDMFHRIGAVSTYDVKPPGSHGITRMNGNGYSHMGVTSFPISQEVHGNESQRSLAGILNGSAVQTTDTGNAAGQRMARQDSSQSQSDLSPFSTKSKFRPYSPFAASMLPNTANGLPVDDAGRKGSDELSQQHRVLLGLAAESKRGRYSPMPQVVQGAQPQTPVPDAVVKTEHGRVFSGLAGGLGTTPPPDRRRDDGQIPLDEENVTKMSRTASGFNKRSRKYQDDEMGLEGELSSSVRALDGRVSKKSKYQQSYKLDLEESGNHGIHRRNTPLAGLNSTRNVNAAGLSNGAPCHPHQRGHETVAVFKPNKLVRVASVFNAASRWSRKHLGNFSYQPNIAPSDVLKPNSHTFDLNMTPNLIPSFSAADHINCTYTIHVSRMWLRAKEREMICAERFLWGSGIYTDDSDPVAAAIHAGFVKASYGNMVDTRVLSRVVQDQNAKIEWPKHLKLPDKPMEIDVDKDMRITLVVLPQLEKYEGTARFGIQSRTWPEASEKTPHDGVSFGILKVEFVNIGTEEMRIGRTGASRRERLQMELQARQRGLQLQDERIARFKRHRLQHLRLKAMAASTTTVRSPPTSIPIPFINGTDTTLTRQIVPVAA